MVTNMLPAGADLIAATFPQTSTTNVNGSPSFHLDWLLSGEGATMTVVMRPNSESALAMTSGAWADQPDPDKDNNVVTLNSNAIIPIVVVSAGATATVAGENRVPANGSVDPGETITLSIAIQNTGNVDATNIVATLAATGGVTAPSAAQSYGPIASGGAPVSRAFTFTADPAATDSIDVTLSLVDVTSTGDNDMGQLAFNYALPVRTAFANAANMTIPDQGAADVYPSTINVTGLVGVIDTVTVVLTDVNHTFPADLDILLVGPGGAGVILMSDAGRGEDLVGANLTFFDAAAQDLPRLNPIVTGSYRPTDHVENLPDVFSGAPGGPYGTQLSAFSGGAPNGDWSLYVVDDAGSDGGSIAGGWSVVIDTVVPVASSAGLSVSVTTSSDAVAIGGNLIYTITVVNEGPATATGVTLTDQLPAGAEIQTVTASQGAVTSMVDPVTVALGDMADDATATVTVTVKAVSVGTLNNQVTVTAPQIDLNPANNSAATQTQVNRVFTLTPMDLDTDLSNGFQLMLQGQGGLTYVIEVSTDLKNWTPVSTNVTFDGTINFNDVSASGMNRRFYRAVER